MERGKIMVCRAWLGKMHSVLCTSEVMRKEKIVEGAQDVLSGMSDGVCDFLFSDVA